MKKDIELLAPVGSKEALIAAVQNGANAVYLGGKLFNARRYASNFDNEELIEAVSYAHLRNVKVYVTVNILLDDSEMNDAIDYAKFLHNIDVDAIIVQDLGFASIVSKLLPDLDLHASTQMTINNLEGAKFLKEHGFKRVVLARETPIDEIKRISNNLEIELETFVHGALCMSYSGQCLMSSMIGGRSGNRGTCAQPCRMQYSIVDKNGNLLQNWEKKNFLSPRDLNTLENLDILKESGIISLKIEGRMKRPEYVATIVKNYRKALDKSINSITNDDKKDIEQIFNRGFTKGLPFNDFGRNFMSIERPDNRGILLGKVVRVDKYKVFIELHEDIEQGDGIEFELKNGEHKGLKAPFNARKGTTIHLEKPGFIESGSLVYKTSSQSLLNRAKESYLNESIKYPIDMSISIRVGHKPKLIVNCSDKNVVITLDKLVEKSQKIAITKDKVIEQLSKLGDTIYYLENIDVEIDDNAFMQVSLLNQLRRDAVDKLNSEIKIINNRKIINNKEFEELKSRYFNFFKLENDEQKKLTIKVSNVKQFEKLDLDKLDRVYLGFYDNLQVVVNKIKEYGKEAYLWTDKILYSNDLIKLEQVLKATKNLDGISVSNIGTMNFVKDRFDLDIHTDIGLNAFNSHTVKFLKENNIKSITLSPELNLSQIRNIIKNIGGNLEGIVYGFLPVMITRNCPMAFIKGCIDDKNCKSCNFANGYGLKDRMGVTFNLERKDGYSVIYNSVPLFVLDNLDSISNAGIDMFRLDFTREYNNITALQKMYYYYLKNDIDIYILQDFVKQFKKDNSITSGHYFRGIL